MAVCLLVLAVGLANLFQAIYTALEAGTLAGLGVRFPIWLAVGAGVIWGLALAWLAWRLWQDRNLSPRVVFLVTGAYSLFQVIWWRVFAAADYARLRWPFAVLMMALFAGGVGGWSLWQRHRQADDSPDTPELQA